MTHSLYNILSRLQSKTPNLFCYQKRSCYTFASFHKTQLCQRMLASFSETPEMMSQLEANIRARGTPFDITKFKHLLHEYNKSSFSNESSQYEELKNLFYRIPNDSHKLTPLGDETHNRQIFANLLPQSHPDNLPRGRSADELMGEDGLCQLRTQHMSLSVPARTCYFVGDLARLESALAQYTLEHVTKSKEQGGAGFQFVAVPDVLPVSVVEACGFPVHNVRNQIYRIASDSSWCLAGTGEMGLASHCASLIRQSTDTLPPFPWRLCTFSRCFRREVPTQEARMYRVHQFSKVEMFVVAKARDSETLFQEIVDIQKHLFSSLGLQFRGMEMATGELGLPAHRKVDIEAWMPGEGKFGEISSASNCTDYQSQRLGLVNSNGEYLHTLNGTACALTRTMKALLETYQTKEGRVVVPKVLVPFMEGIEELRQQHPPLHLHWIRGIKPLSASQNQQNSST